MCGIAGFECGEGWEGTAASLERSLANRGPDGSWTKRVGRYCLVQTRLAVIDRSPRVVYPMPNETENLWLLFNGEIYGVPRGCKKSCRHAVTSFEPAVTQRSSSTPTRSGASTPFLG